MNALWHMLYEGTWAHVILLNENMNARLILEM